MFICDYCNNKIESKKTIFKGFDCNFCSKNCREIVKNFNIKRDVTLSNYKLWFNSKPTKTTIPSTIKRTQSIIDLQLKYNIINIININNDDYDNNDHNNFAKLLNIFKNASISIISFKILIISTIFYFK